MSMHKEDWLALAREHWVPLTVIGAFVIGVIVGKIA
jgi:hypothetical protein